MDRELEVVMKQRTKDVALQCLVFVFFLCLATNGVYENSVLNKRLLQLRETSLSRDIDCLMSIGDVISSLEVISRDTDENFALAQQDVNDLFGYMIDSKFQDIAQADDIIEVAKFARRNRDRLEQETILALPGVIASTMKSVVHIEWPSIQRPSRNSSGTGWVIDAEQGYIVTAAHCAKNFKGQAKTATVEFMGDRRVRVDKVWVDPNDDMAVLVLDVNDPNYIDVTALKLAAAYDLNRGDLLLTLGGPYGYKFSAGFGIVSNPLVDTDVFYPAGHKGNRLQFDTTQNPGNSGGALVNIRGEVVGVGVSGISGCGSDSGVNFGVTLDGIRSSLERFDLWLCEMTQPGVVEMVN